MVLQITNAKLPTVFINKVWLVLLTWAGIGREQEPAHSLMSQNGLPFSGQDTLKSCKWNTLVDPKTGIRKQKDMHVQATYLLRTVAHPELYKMARSALRPSATQLQTGLCCCRTSNISLVAVSMHRSRRIAECGQRNCSWKAFRV